MKYTSLSNTDVTVSKICLGSMTWGEQNTEAEGHEQLDYSISKGINFIDTAEMYSVPGKAETFGATEKIIGNWLAKRGNRQSVVIATKITGPSEGFSYIRDGSNFSSKQIKQALNGSLKRLKTDYIDLYQLHWPERYTNYFGQLGYTHKSDYTGHRFERVLETLESCVKEGKIRYIGLSNETPWGVMKFLAIAKEKGLPKFVSIQNPYNLLNRTYEIGLAEISIREKIGLLAYSPIGGGILSGKYLHNQHPANARFTLFGDVFSRYKSCEVTNATEAYINLAKKFNISPVKMALSYVNSRDFLTANIIGATSMEQLKENIDSITLDLPEELLNEIENIHKKYSNPAP